MIKILNYWFFKIAFPFQSLDLNPIELEINRNIKKWDLLIKKQLFINMLELNISNKNLKKNVENAKIIIAVFKSKGRLFWRTSNLL